MPDQSHYRKLTLREIGEGAIVIESRALGSLVRRLGAEEIYAAMDFVTDFAFDD